ncbi:hemerythrin domain-containing protein [Pelotalea chapellei]|uniref:Hemerythrin domain-containing protein n=1 Tax=Pelotalea chapellei TaxID=44671 RepID=A0ABS5UCI5_9BACT|nr:hemerythrin domain-containing protein [Pelotalea chapellei]MBT1073428.1 hemerythrin domain-containing protein [Pelotalea chapellei]
MAQQSSNLQSSKQLFDLLKSDHRQAEKLMKQIESASYEKREALFAILKQELTLHMQMEEKEFYPKLQKIAEMSDQVEDALQEHKEAREYLAELEDLDQDEDEWLSSFQDMQEGIQHHVEDEEQEIFPDCKKFLSEEQLGEIAQKCIQMKEKSQKPSSRTASKGGLQRQTRKQPGARS